MPSPHPAGPIKGAFALANALVSEFRVILVFLKHGPGADAILHEHVEVKSLAGIRGGWRFRLAAYRSLLEAAGGRRHVVSISMCLSADWINRLCKAQAVTCSSVRGNLLKNYRLDYGLLGVPLAIGHLLSLRAFDYVVAMTDSMASQLRLLAGLNPRVIGNFVDEAALEPYRQISPGTGPLRFVFVGTLSIRKQPELVIKAIESIKDKDVELDIVGDGPLREYLRSLVDSLGLQKRVRLHGHVADPHVIVADADVFVLPSRSEGVSRAALEALYLGVPCVLRNVDGNAELLVDSKLSALFVYEKDLSITMHVAAERSRSRSARHSLLPKAFQQNTAVNQFLRMLDY